MASVLLPEAQLMPWTASLPHTPEMQANSLSGQDQGAHQTGPSAICFDVLPPKPSPVVGPC